MKLLSHQEIPDAVLARLGIRLAQFDYADPGFLLLGSGHLYRCTLHGPYMDDAVPYKSRRDLRLYVVYRVLGSLHSLDLLVQDADDDAFLNSNAVGAGKYRDILTLWAE